MKGARILPDRAPFYVGSKGIIRLTEFQESEQLP